MKKSRFTEQQIAMILKHVDDGLGVDDACRKAGVWQQTYYRPSRHLLRNCLPGNGEVNVNRVYWHYTELGLQIRNKRPKRKVSAKLREDRRPPQGPNEVWAMRCPASVCHANAERGLLVGSAL